MIEAMLYNPADSSLKQGGAELINQWQNIPDSLIWVTTQDEDPVEEASMLEASFGIHPHAIKDAQRDRHPPKIEAFDGISFLLLKALDSNTTTIDYMTIQLAMFLGERFLVTRSSGISVSTKKIWDEVIAGDYPPDSARALLALRLCRAVSDRFMPALLAVEKRLEELETEMLLRPTDKLLGELVTQKGDLRKMLRILQYHAQIFSAANSDAPAELAEHQHELNDVRDQLDRHLGLAHLYYDLTDDLMNGYLSLSAHRLNQVMQTLTIVTVIFVPVTFIAGVYGMNFENMPELKFQYSYFILLGVLLAVMVSFLMYFKRKGWLGSRVAKNN